MAVRKLKPIEERDPYAALVLQKFDGYTTQEGEAMNQFEPNIPWPPSPKTEEATKQQEPKTNDRRIPIGPTDV